MSTNWELVAYDHGVPTVDMPAPLNFKHRFVDDAKPMTGTDLVVADIDGDGLDDLACAAWWYKNPTWERYAIPGIYQVINAFDIDGDGRQELIATKKRASEKSHWYFALSSELWWLKPIDPIQGRWEEHFIDAGIGDWLHGSLVAPFWSDGKLALIVSHHSVNAGKLDYPALFEIPSNPRETPWQKRTLAEIMHGEELLACDVNGDRLNDVVAGAYWLENLGDGNFCPHPIIADKEFLSARSVIVDVNRDGAPDVVMGQELVYWKAKTVPLAPLVWMQNPRGEWDTPWRMRVIDYLACAHSVDAADLDDDGEMEIVAGEHNPFAPYTGGCRLFVYKKANPHGTAWWRWLVDDRFEHHDGTKIIQLARGKLGIASHGWSESKYVHLWEPQ